MIEIKNLRKEARYGMPNADKVLFNRHYIAGYSYYFRQPKWVLEIVNPPTIQEQEVERLDNFRPDLRIPPMFRAEKVDFKGSGFDRGHLVPSANQIGMHVQNSETFLLSNMAPQYPNFNRKIWRELETAVRELNAKEEVLETYVVSGPIFYFDQEVITIGAEDDNEVSIPVPHAFFKSILTEKVSGHIEIWSFIIPHKTAEKPLSSYLEPTIKVERLSGLLLWETLIGESIEKQKSSKNTMWD